MKKVLFSAVAMIAFTGASMANTKEVKVTSSQKLKTNAIAEKAPYGCGAVYNSTYIYARNQNFTDAQAVSIASAAQRACLDITTCND